MLAKPRSVEGIVHESVPEDLAQTGHRILIVEDNATLAYGLKINLEVDGHEVLVVADGEAALSSPDAFSPDLIILDIMLPKLDGFELLRRWRRSGVSTRIIVLSARGEAADRVLGLRLGADDYLAKPFHLLELLERVRRQLFRLTCTLTKPGRIITVGNSIVDMAARTVVRENGAMPLPPKEYALFSALLDAHGAAIAKELLLHKVWGHKAAVRTNTVEYHVMKLRQKIEINAHIPRHILTVSRCGYRLQL